MQQGRYVGKLIRRRIAGKNGQRPFRYFDKGNMAVVGKGFAVIQSGKLQMSGFLAWLAWAAVHLEFLAQPGLRISVFVQWIWTFVTGQRGSRLIVDHTGPGSAKSIPAMAASTAPSSQPRVERIAAALSRRGLRTGDRLAVLLPNGPEYIELVYACSRLGVIVVPLNARYSSREIDRVLKDASPRALVRHSGSAPTRANLEWQLALDKEPLDAPNGLCPEVYYCPEAILAMIYTRRTTGEAKGVMLTHTNVLSNVNCLNYWMRYRQGGVYLHAAPIFHGADFPAMFAAPGFWRFAGCSATL